LQRRFADVVNVSEIVRGCVVVASVQKLPGKFRKMYTDFETMMDPSRNHRVYRLAVGKLRVPMIPFMPLLMKGRPTHTHTHTHTPV